MYLGWCYGLHVGMASNSRERSPWSDAVAAQIRAERAAQKWTQAEMSRRANIPRQTYIRIEAGTRVADSTQLARICGAIGIRMSQFFRRVEERQPEG